MSNVVKCERCQKSLIDEEYSSHVCTPNLRGIKEIEVDYYYEHTSKNGDKVIMAKGLDGFLYRLKKRLSTESKHDKDYRQGNSSCVKVLYNLRDIFTRVLVGT